MIEEGGAITFLFLALTKFNNFLPSIANFFRSSTLSFFVPSFVLPSFICFFTDAWLLNDPSTEEIEPAEFGGLGCCALVPFVGVDWEILCPAFVEGRDARDVVDGLNSFGTKDSFVDDMV